MKNENKKYSLSMVVPAYNEEELLESFIRKSVADMERAADDFEIVLVNDGSTDKTAEIAKKLAREFPQLKVINLEKNFGTGASIIPAFKAASKEIVFNNTVDAFFDTLDLPKLLPYLKNYDVVSGCRSDLKANTFYQKILTVCNYLLIRFLFGLPLKAYQTLQFHRNTFFKQVIIEARSSFISPELLIKAHKSGKSIKEVEITFHPRKAGRPKGGNPRQVLRSIKDVFKFWILWTILKKPIIQ